jgi:hypothetical protein
MRARARRATVRYAPDGIGSSGGLVKKLLLLLVLVALGAVIAKKVRES